MSKFARPKRSSSEEMLWAYGQTALAANTIEQQLIGLLLAYEGSTNDKPVTILKLADELYYKPMGALIKRLNAKVKLPTSLASDLEIIRERRNFFAHHFFRERAPFMKRGEWATLTTELDNIRKLMSETYDKLDPLTGIAIKELDKKSNRLE